MKRLVFVLLLIFSLIISSGPVSPMNCSLAPLDELDDDSIDVLNLNAHDIVESSIESMTSVPAQTSYEYDKTVAVVVESTLFSLVSSAVAQYIQDLNYSGYNTVLYTEVINSAEELKGNLTHWYQYENLVGAVLIGRLPYAQFYHDSSPPFSASTFICDLYLMDLDGVWTDTSPVDGVYDGHSAGSLPSDIYPEIFVGRIDPTCLSWISSVPDAINEYLTHIHNYRTGGAQRTRRALVYIDDDWSGYYGTLWAGDVGLAFSTATIIQTPSETNAADWLNRVVQDYQWGHLCAHSSATMHAFGPDGTGTEGTVTSMQIHSAPPSFNFYNLFCCSGAKWTITNNLAVAYTFSGNYSLASIGSSKTGSMMDCQFFYGPLSENATLGESLVNWFSQSLNNYSTAQTQYVEWYYGMNIVGDPLLAIYYDCTALPPQVYSITHPEQQKWYTDTYPQLNWTTPLDVNGIEGYYYMIDQNPVTVPNPETANFTKSNGVSFIEGLDDGSWYFHIITRDMVGSIGPEAAHYRIHIDTTPPSAITLQPTQQNLATDSFRLIWTVQDDQSGYSHAVVWIDDEMNIVYSGSDLSYLIQELSEGSHIVNITVYDRALHSLSMECNYYIDLTDPILTIINPVVFTLQQQSFVINWSVIDTGSGYHRAEISVDGELLETTDGNVTSVRIEDLSWGMHTINMTVFDRANRYDSIEFQIFLEDPFLKLAPPLILVGVVSSITLFIIYHRRR